MGRGSQWAWDNQPINSGGTRMSKAFGCKPADMGVIRVLLATLEHGAVDVAQSLEFCATRVRL